MSPNGISADCRRLTSIVASRRNSQPGAKGRKIRSKSLFPDVCRNTQYSTLWRETSCTRPSLGRECADPYGTARTNQRELTGDLHQLHAYIRPVTTTTTKTKFDMRRMYSEVSTYSTYIHRFGSRTKHPTNQCRYSTLPSSLAHSLQMLQMYFTWPLAFPTFCRHRSWLQGRNAIMRSWPHV
jgi:hypothetical protein